MKLDQGWFGLLQYCPCLEREEFANVGVFLWVPSQNFAQGLVDGSLSGVRQRFGKKSYDEKRLLLSVEGLSVLLKQEAQLWQEGYRAAMSHREGSLTQKESRVLLGPWLQWSQSLGNNLKVSQPKMIFTEECQSTLQELYGSLVQTGATPRVKRQRKPNLQQVFEAELVGVPLQRDVKIEIPELGERFGQMHVPYAYKNGQWNYVTSEAFPRSEADALSKAHGLAVKGGLIAKHREPDGLGRQLVVVGSLPSGGEAREAIQATLREYNTRLVLEEDLKDFMVEVRMQAHA